MFLVPNFFGGPPPEFLKSIYKIQSDSDHLTKFQGDRSRELGASVAKQKKTSAAEYKPVRNGGSGRPKNYGNTIGAKCSLNLQSELKTNVNVSIFDIG